jgi:hypothetical protein
MKTINTAAYAAVAATTSKGLLTVAVDIIAMNTQMKPVIIFNLVSLADTNSSHHIGASSMANPINMINAVVNVSNFWVLEYTVAADLMCSPSTSFARKIRHRCSFRQDSSHEPRGVRLRELMDIRSHAFFMNDSSSASMAPLSSQLTMLSTWRFSARGRARTLEKASMNWSF